MVLVNYSMNLLPRPKKAIFTLTQLVDHILIVSVITGQRRTIEIATLSLTRAHACIMQIANLLTESLLLHGTDQRINALIRFEEEYYGKE